jgi:hypothetical protein
MSLHIGHKKVLFYFKMYCMLQMNIQTLQRRPKLWKYDVKAPNDFTSNELDLVYPIFENVWQETLNELTGLKSFTSDAFLNADEVATLTYRDEIAAIHLYNYHNLNNFVHIKKSCFEAYNTNTFSKIKDLGNTTCTFEFLTVNPKLRKSKLGIHVAPVIAALGLQYTTPKVDLVLTTTFNKRRVNELSESLGGKIVEGGLKMHNQDVSVYSFEYNNINFPSDHKEKVLAKNLAEQYIWVPGLKKAAA